MHNILITGATGNVGKEVIRFLNQIKTNESIIAGLRNTQKSASIFTGKYAAQLRLFDFENPDTFSSLEGVDIVFLLRPPHISDVNKVFSPLFEHMKNFGVKKVVFLSVQGVEKSKVIPHHKIENLIYEGAFEYIFVRPSYFMQNLTTTLYNDLKNKHQIILPAGKAVFNWVDINNIAEATAHLIINFSRDKNQALEITGPKNINFYEVAALISDQKKKTVTFRNTNPLHFFLIKKRQDIPTPMIIVMIMLHYLPRFQKEPNISEDFEKITGKKPNTLKEFLRSELTAL